MRRDRLPLTYDECRARFRHQVLSSGLGLSSHALEARGPEGQRLDIDMTTIGNPRPRRALVVLSGVHGVEGFAGSELQVAAVERWAGRTLPADAGVVVVHAVNPWGMAWSRRQNEHNVDLNRNWRRSQIDPPHNEAYDEVHPLACPDGDEPPSVEELLVAAAGLVERRGERWVRQAITAGQYRHPDGLHFGGDRTEESTAVVEAWLRAYLSDAHFATVVDLHTGHGPYGEVTLLSDQPPDSAQHRFFTEELRAERVEATVANPDATTGEKSGQIANGVRQLVAGPCFATSLELGTASDAEQLVATFHEQWLHRCGDRADPSRAPIVRAYRACFTPDDPEWEAAVLVAGGRHLDAALDAVLGADPSSLG